MAISQIVAALIQIEVLGDSIISRAFFGSFGLSVPGVEQARQQRLPPRAGGCRQLGGGATAGAQQQEPQQLRGQADMRAQRGAPGGQRAGQGRLALGAAELPLGAPVELEMIVEVG